LKNVSFTKNGKPLPASFITIQHEANLNKELCSWT